MNNNNLLYFLRLMTMSSNQNFFIIYTTICFYNFLINSNKKIFDHKHNKFIINKYY